MATGFSRPLVSGQPDRRDPSTRLSWNRAARENSDFRSDRQDTQAQSLKETGEIFNGWDIIRKLKTTAFMKKGHLRKGNMGNGELAVLPAFFKGCGSTPAEP